MALVTVERKGGTALLTYANPPMGTMTAAGASEMHAAMAAAVDDPEVRVVVITGGLPGIFVRHYDVGELSDISEAVALEMILLGKVVDGPTAGEIGLVNEVANDPLARALAIAAELGSRPAEGLAYAKRLTRAALDRPISEGLADERRSFGEILRIPSARAGLAAGRPPAEIQKI